jgi:hypothetical protein
MWACFNGVDLMNDGNDYVTTGGIDWVPGLCGRTVSRVPHIQFTRKLFLRIPDVHRYLVVREKVLFRLS